jgi:transitional endoplasmic reticulum ATPase
MENESTNAAVHGASASDALSFYSAALEKEPNNVHLCAEAARCYMRLDDFKKAWAYAERMLTIGVAEPNDYYLCAAIAERRGDLARATELYDKAVELAPDDPEFRIRRAKLCNSRSKYAEAVADCTHLLALNPRNTEALLVRAEAYLNMEKSAEAAKDFRTVLEVEPGNPQARYALERMDRMVMYAEKEKEKEKARQRMQRRHMPSLAVKPEAKVTFADVVGLEHAKKELRRAIIYPLRNPALASRYGVRAGGGVLLYGPPGTGKTLLARAVVGEANANLINLKISEVLSQWVGIAEKRISRAFEEAREKIPAIIFIDEFDLLGSSRLHTDRSWLRSIVDTILAEMDGLATSNQSILVLAATNMPWSIDPALKRHGRFGKEVYVPPPDAQQREELFKMHLKGKPLDEGVDYAELARRSELCTGADIKGICDTASSEAYEAAAESGAEVKIGMDLLLRAAGSERRSLKEWYEDLRPKMNDRGLRQLYPELAADAARYDSSGESEATYYR